MAGIPFTAYDIFAYLTAGFVVIAAADFAFSGNWILDAELTLVEGFVWAVVAYVLGHVISALSAPLIEQGFTEKLLGHRVNALFGEPDGKLSGNCRFRWWFRGYFDELPERIRSRVRKQAWDEAEIEPDAAIKAVGEALFLYCDAKVRQKPEAAPELGRFLNTYSFARNACLASLVAAPLLLVGAYDMNWQTKASIALAAVAAPLGLLYRYLKFFRLYAREVFLFYVT